jgi:hypothetical protein
VRALIGISDTMFKLRGLATIADIPTGEFNALIASLQKEGWRRTYEYTGFDAWIDYGCIKLRKRGVTLKCEWDNWSEGSVVGPALQVKELAVRLGRPALDQ